MEANLWGRWTNIESRGNKAHLSIFKRDKMICDCEKGQAHQTGFEILEDKIECPHCGKAYELRRSAPPKNNPFTDIVQMIVDDGVEIDPSTLKGTTAHKISKLQKGRI